MPKPPDEPAPWVDLKDSKNIRFFGGGFSGDRQAVRAENTEGLHFTHVAFGERLKAKEWKAWLEITAAAVTIIGVVFGILFGFHVI